MYTRKSLQISNENEAPECLWYMHMHTYVRVCVCVHAFYGAK